MDVHAYLGERKRQREWWSYTWWSSSMQELQKPLPLALLLSLAFTSGSLLSYKRYWNKFSYTWCYIHSIYFLSELKVGLLVSTQICDYINPWVERKIRISCQVQAVSFYWMFKLTRCNIFFFYSFLFPLFFWKKEKINKRCVLAKAGFAFTLHIIEFSGPPSLQGHSIPNEKLKNPWNSCRGYESLRCRVMKALKHTDSNGKDCDIKVAPSNYDQKHPSIYLHLNNP